MMPASCRRLVITNDRVIVDIVVVNVVVTVITVAILASLPVVVVGRDVEMN